MSAHRDGVSHWDDVYAGSDASRSWFQACPLMSLKMLDAAGVTASDSLIDVGGGASRLAGALLGRGFRDITVLDISVTGMRYAQDRLGSQAAGSDDHRLLMAVRGISAVRPWPLRWRHD